MSATATGTIAGQEFEQLKAKLKTTWMTGDYDRFARYMEKDAAVFYERLGIAPGARLLDVGCGSGQLALIAARAGAQVTGCDIASNWIEKARARAAAEGLQIQFDEGDAESLPYGDGQFDAVASLVGAMFAPRPEAVASELTRVCRPGGIIAMANWTSRGFVGQMFKVIARHIAPSGMPSPVLWGDEAAVRERFREGIAELKFTLHSYKFEYPFSPEKVVEFFQMNYGPMTRAFASLEASEQEKMRSELVQLWSANNYGLWNTTKVDAEYLQVIASREGGRAVTQQGNGTSKSGSSARRRAQALADRIEEGAATLAAFAEGLTEDEWRVPLTESGKKGRSVGVVVHHVASMYPIEIDAAQAIASGKAVTDVTWDVVAGLNAKHAQEHAGITKSAALELVRRNSRAAADAVRAFTDEQLDQAAPFSLSFGAPMTAQFVIEDHALRHSWHHLAGIRKALGR